MDTSYQNYLRDLAELLNVQVVKEQEVTKIKAEYEQRIANAEAASDMARRRINALINFLKIEHEATGNTALKSKVDELVSSKASLPPEEKLPIDSGNQDTQAEVREVEAKSETIEQEIKPEDLKNIADGYIRDYVYVNLLYPNPYESYTAREMQNWILQRFSVGFNYANNVAGRGRKRGLLEKNGDKYRLTKQGVEYAEGLLRNGFQRERENEKQAD